MAEDTGHYYLAEFEPYVDSEFGFDGDRPALYGDDFVDLRATGSRTGVALVRSTKQVQPLPAGASYIGQGVGRRLPAAQSTEVRRRLGIRGEVASTKDVLRSMLLTESDVPGRPGRLQPEPDGGFYVRFGDLRVDLSDTAG